jgi:hypothetical protein
MVLGGGFVLVERTRQRFAESRDLGERREQIGGDLAAEEAREQPVRRGARLRARRGRPRRSLRDGQPLSGSFQAASAG